MIQKMIIEYLTAPEVKEKVLKALNDAVDVPIISEKTEAKILEGVWSTVSEVLVKVIEGKKA